MKIIRFLICFAFSTTLCASDAPAPLDTNTVPEWGVKNPAYTGKSPTAKDSKQQTQITLTPQKPLQVPSDGPAPLKDNPTRGNTGASETVVLKQQPQTSDDKPNEFWCPQYGYGEEAARIIYGLTSPSNFKRRYYGDHKNAYQATALIGALAALAIDIAQIESIDKKTSLATPLSLAKNTTGAAFGLKDIYAICANSPNKYYSVAGLSRVIPAIVQWIGHVSNQKLISQNQQAFDAYFKENSTIVKSKNARESAKQMLYLLTGMRFVFAALFSVFTSNFQSANVVCRVAEQLVQAVQQLIIFKVRQDRIKYAISSQAHQPEAQ